MYEVIDVDPFAPETTEPLGTKPKFWYRNQEGELWLFKQSLQNSGEHWAEKATSELCRLLGIPHAVYELARWKGQIGVVSRTFVPDGGRLVLGNELLARVFRGYDPALNFRQQQHTLSRVLAVVRDPSLLVPIGYDAAGTGIGSALGVFLGYLMLDAWIANQDRHHANWGLVVDPESTVHLTPSFDHGSSLGRNERDQLRLERLRTRDRGRSVEQYAARAKSALYRHHVDRHPLETLGAFLLAGRADLASARAWLDRLEQITDENVMAVFAAIPSDHITEIAAEFAMTLLRINRRRLLEIRAQL